MQVSIKPPQNSQGAQVSVTPRANQQKRRELIIDLFRGLAVAIMIITHVIGIAYDHDKGASDIVYYIGLYGGIVSFTSFLFISGVGSYFSYLNNGTLTEEEQKKKRGKIIGRALKILIVYYILATLSTVVNTSLYSLPPSTTWITNFALTLTFIIVPAFTEFLIAFVFYQLSLVPLKRLYRFLLANPIVGLFSMAAFYTLGTVLLKIDLHSNELNMLKALLAGHNYSFAQLHTFPILQYFPIFMLGIYFGKFLFGTQDKYKRLKIILIWIICSFAIAGAFTIAYRYIPTHVFYPLPDEGRFPPSISFLGLSMGLSLFSFAILFIFYKLIPNFIKVFIHFLGVNALEMFFFHLVFLFLYKYLTINEYRPNGIQHPYLTDIIILYIITLVVCSLLFTIKNSIKHWVLQDSQEKIWWIFTERAVSTLVFVVVISVAATSFYKSTFVKPAAADTSNVQFKKRLIREEEWPKWWNHDYTVSRQLIIKNNNTAQPLFSGSWVSFAFNHEQAVGGGKASSAEGKDIRVVYYNDDLAEFTELTMLIDNPNTTATQIAFKLSRNINPGESTDKYFLYYGNEFATEYPASKDRYTTPPFSEGVTLETETLHSIAGKVNRRWLLKKKSAAYQSAALQFDITINNPNITPNSIVTYSIPGTDKNGRMKKISDTKYQAAIVVSDLDPGTYRIQANITDSKDNLKIYRSDRVPFYVTYPIYVTWTIDWEGFDVGNDNINTMGQIADQHEIHMTHFFNPRIYSPGRGTSGAYGISDDRASFLTKWVQDRQKNHYEEIGMHIHMWDDMVRAAGVTPKYVTAVGGAMYGDTLTNAYTREEIDKIMKWGREQFSYYELGAPISYRTGGWMSGPNVLQAAQDSGFLIDSSGRTAGPINPAVSWSTPVPWDLQVTTRPYLPDVNNINTWSAAKSDRLKLWEIPNNGADSYWFETKDLISRFDANYPNKNSIMTSPQVVTYLSHPHWFLVKDVWKIRGLFDYTDKFLYKDDKGPVVYSTLETIYSEWDKDKFFNGN